MSTQYMELRRIDSILDELRRRKFDARPSDKIYLMARIDSWLDKRLEVMNEISL